MKKIIAPILIFLVILVLLIPKFVIKSKIVCRNQDSECPEEVRTKLSSFDGKSIYITEKRIKKVLKDDFLVSTFNIQFKLPNIIKVEMIAKKPICYLTNPGSDKFASIDSEGYVLAVATGSGTPLLTTSSPIPGVSEKIDDKEYLALQLMDGVNKMYQVGRGVIDGNALLVELPGGVRVIFPLVGADRELLLGSLRLVYADIEAKDGGAIYKEIDLRYQNPVLR